MKVGAEPKKIAILVALLAFAGYQFLNWSSEPASTPPAPRPAPVSSTATVSTTAATPAAAPVRGVQRATPARRSSSSRTLREFRPVFQAQPTEDPMSIDPSLRLDILDRVASVTMRGGQRNLFQFGIRPPNPAEAKAQLPQVAKIIPGEGAGPGIDPSAEPKDPPTPPIPLQYFGFTQKAGHGPKRAFFLEGEEIFVAAEGDLVKRRYKVVRIGVNSVVIEDTDSKKEQTLRMVEQVG